jgi:hypothetical protein
MTLQDLAGMFNRSWDHAFNFRKFLALFLVLVLTGLIFIFFYGVAIYATNWFGLALHFVPVFIGMALLMAVGSVLVQNAIDEKEGSDPKKITVESMFVRSGKFFIRACSFALPLLGAFLCLWILLGLLILLKAIPFVGILLGIVMAFGPFLLNLAMILLIVAAVGSLFFFTPLLATKAQFQKKDLTDTLKADLFTHLVTFILSVIPVWFVWKLVKGAANLTFQVYSISELPVMTVLQSFFILIPAAAALTFPLIFFFN